MTTKNKVGKRPGPIVEIEWFDAQSSMESMSIEEIKEHLKPMHTMSVGYLLHDTDNYIVLGFMDFGNGFIKHHQVIPKGMIVNKTRIKHVKR